MAVKIENIPYLKFEPKLEFKEKYINFLGIPLESMFEHKGKYNCYLIENVFVEDLNSIKTRYYLKGKFEDGEKAINYLMHEITEAKKHLTYRDDTKKINSYVEDFIDDIAHYRLLQNVIKSQPKNITLSLDLMELSPYLKKNKDELYLEIGKMVNQKNRDLFYKDMNKKLLKGEKETVIKLPEGKENLSKEEKTDYRFGKRLFKSLKKTLFDILCDPKDRVGKEVLSKDSIVEVITKTFTKMGIIQGEIIFSSIALVLLYSLNVFCKMVKPN